MMKESITKKAWILGLIVGFGVLMVGADCFWAQAEHEPPPPEPVPPGMEGMPRPYHKRLRGIEGELAREEAEAHRIFERIEEFVESELPAALELLEEVKEEVEQINRPEEKFELFEAVHRLADMAQRMVEVKREEPEAYPKVKEMYELEIEAQRLSRAFSKASEEEQKEIKRELRKVLERNFEISQEVRELEAKRVEEELKEIRSLLEERQKHREIIIDRHMHTLLYGEDPLAW